jgi:amino acid transporter
MQDFEGIISATYSNNWAEYLVQLLGKNGAVAILSILWVDSTCATASCFMSAQRVTFAISRDGVLPFSKYFRKLNKNKIPVHAAFLVCGMSIAITCAVIGSTVAFTAITATATIATNFSYLIPIVARHTVGRKSFQPAKWNLGKWSPVLGLISGLYIMFLFIVLLLPQLYPVTSVSYESPRRDAAKHAIVGNPKLRPNLHRNRNDCQSDWLDLTIWARRKVLVYWAKEDH